jgi:hypothetical protein
MVLEYRKAGFAVLPVFPPSSRKFPIYDHRSSIGLEDDVSRTNISLAEAGAILSSVTDKHVGV